MAICYYCSGSARCHVCTGTGIQGDGRTCAVCGGNGRCTHCTGGVMRGPDAILGRLAVAERATIGLRWTALALLVASFGAAATPARADYRIVDFTQAKATKATGTIDPEDGVLVRGAIGPGKAIANTLTFTPQQPTLAVSISWLVGTATARFRLIGVNVDLKNNAGSLVASDTFQGLVAGVATSVLNFDGLIPGAKYKLTLTGTSVGVGSYTMAVVTAP
ncbi:MAG: hypothetical protein WAS21_20255 [Geminicoccaceae bacterium]